MRKALVMIIAVCGLASMVMAEDATGTWKATLDTPNGAEETTIVLKAEGDKVTGAVSSGMLGERPISDGKVDGGKIAFSINSDFGLIAYAGTIQGDDMKLTLTVGDGQFTLDFVAKRQK
jgi:hypothetical protein